MGVRVLFLGKLAEVAGTEEMHAPAPLNWEAIHAAWDAKLVEVLAGERVLVAVNGQVLPDKTALAASDGNEIAFLPPVSGG